jgi:hypothetical protein
MELSASKPLEDLSPPELEALWSAAKLKLAEPTSELTAANPA